MANFDLIMDGYNSSQNSSLGDEELTTIGVKSRPASTAAATKSGVKKFQDWLLRSPIRRLIIGTIYSLLSLLFKSFVSEAIP